MVLFFLFKTHLLQLLPQARTCSNWNAQAHTWGWLISLPWEYFLKPYSHFIKDIFKVHLWIFSILQSSRWKGYVTIYGSCIRFSTRQPMRGVKKKERNSYSTRSPNFCFRVGFLALISPLEKPDQWKGTWCESLVSSSLLGAVFGIVVYLAGNPALEAQATSAQKTKMVHREHCSQLDLHLCTKRLHFF